jgi:hypothetical protein
VQTSLMADTGHSRALQRLLQVLSHPYLLFLLAAFAVWIPQGFNIGPVNDGWVQMASGLLRWDPSRVFGNIPVSIGMMLTPDRFIGVQLVILTMMVLHASFFYEIVKRLLPGRALVALAAGLIGLFHSADRSYFWVGAMGLQFGLTTALGSALCAILYLDLGRRRYLAATLILQLLSVFTYPGFLPLIMGVPLGAWLLRRLSGARPSASFLFKVNLPWVVAGCLYVYLLHAETGRNAKVADIHFAAALSGYTWALHGLFRTIPEVFKGLRLGYFLPALLAAALAYPAAAAAARRDQVRPPEAMDGWRYLGLALAGLLLLALASYLPYSISKVRYNNSRTLLAGGMFAYTAVAVALLAWLQPRLNKAWLVGLLMALTGYTVLVGQYERDGWVEPYRAEEHLLAAIAASVPHPIPGTVFLVYLHEPDQTDGIGGFYNRELIFSVALRHMYREYTLSGRFYGFGDDQVSFGPDGLNMRGYHRSLGPLQRYQSLIVVDYPAGASFAPVLDRSWLEQQAGSHAAAAAGYTPRFGTTPTGDAIMCSMLEQGSRPGYCH